MMEYRFSNLGLSGCVRLCDRSVTWRCRYCWHGTYEREIPLSKLQPEFIRTVGPANNLGQLMGVSAIGVLVAYFLVHDKFVHILSAYTALGISLTALVALVIFLKHRKEEWIYFRSSDASYALWFCRRGPDSQSFDAFTSALRDRIRSAIGGHDHTND